MFYNCKFYFILFYCALTLQLAFTLCIGFDITYSSLLFCCCPFKLDIFVVLNTFVSFILALKLSSIFGALKLLVFVSSFNCNMIMVLKTSFHSSSFWRLHFTHHCSKVIFVFGTLFVFLFITCLFKVLFVFVFTIHFHEMQIWTTTFYEQLFIVTSLFSTILDLSQACKFLQFQLVFCVRKAHSPFFCLSCCNPWMRCRLKPCLWWVSC